MTAEVGVLIIDDSPEWARHFEKAVLKIDGMKVVGTAGAADAAIELMDRLKPQIVILDLMLENSSGIEVLKRLRQNGWSARIIAVTGAPSEPVKSVCLQLGASYFFDKTFDFEELPNALRSLLDRIHQGQ